MISEEVWEEWQSIARSVRAQDMSPEALLPGLVADPRGIQQLDTLWRLLDTAVRFGDIRRAVLLAQTYKKRLARLLDVSVAVNLNKSLRLSP